MIRVLELTEELLPACADAHLIPRTGQATHEIWDEFNRITHRMELADGNMVEFQFRERLKLGKIYPCYGAETNPKPVSPVFTEMQAVEPVP